MDEFESAVRSVCEPIFDRPLREISFGKVLLRLFQISRRFSMEVQPQLVLLQKTLLNIEGLGRDLDPDLDLWTTARPFLETWMAEQVGFKGLVRQLRSEAPLWARMLPQLPRLVYQAVNENRNAVQEEYLTRLLDQQKRQGRWLSGLAIAVGVLLCLQVYWVWH